VIDVSPAADAPWRRLAPRRALRKLRFSPEQVQVGASVPPAAPRPAGLSRKASTYGQAEEVSEESMGIGALAAPVCVQ
jgi:hypothetical protein